jgi:hypothetical protein
MTIMTIDLLGLLEVNAASLSQKAIAKLRHEKHVIACTIIESAVSPASDTTKPLRNLTSFSEFRAYILMALDIAWPWLEHLTPQKYECSAAGSEWSNEAKPPLSY